MLCARRNIATDGCVDPECTPALKASVKQVENK